MTYRKRYAIINIKKHIIKIEARSATASGTGHRDRLKPEYECRTPKSYRGGHGIAGLYG